MYPMLDSRCSKPRNKIAKATDLHRDRRITAITPAFQAGDVGSTPIGRSIPTSSQQKATAILLPHLQLKLVFPIAWFLDFNAANQYF